MKKLLTYSFKYLGLLIALYLIGLFITLDSNPLNWYLINDEIGRIFFVIYALVILVVIIDK